MAQKVNLDAMIRREDFAREIKGAPAPSIIRELKLSDLLPSAAIRRQLRKPEFQRETNHWTHDQVLKLLTAFSMVTLSHRSFSGDLQTSFS
jgi:hypothetical protein